MLQFHTPVNIDWCGLIRRQDCFQKNRVEGDFSHTHIIWWMLQYVVGEIMLTIIKLVMFWKVE